MTEFNADRHHTLCVVSPPRPYGRDSPKSVKGGGLGDGVQIPSPVKEPRRTKSNVNWTPTGESPWNDGWMETPHL